MSLRQWSLTLIALVAISVLSGCGNTFGVKEVDYVAPAKTGEGKITIFVFRENSAFGGARKFSIINNDEIVGVLTPGTYTHYTVDSGENEVVAYMSPSPLTHLRVSGGSGETVYLFCHMGYSSGIYMEEIDLEQAQSLMKEFKYTQITVEGAKAKMDYKHYYNSLYY
jgi:hypothetical protein